jgi:hypothetical protein
MIWVVSGLLYGTMCVEISSIVGCGQVCVIVCRLVWILSSACVFGGVLWVFACDGLFCTLCCMNICVPPAL